jgi:DNA-binding NarL/FixJ family response regulator
LKDAAPNELEIALKAVIRERFILVGNLKHLRGLFERLQNTRKVPSQITEQLTASNRNSTVIAEGNSTKEIANKLFISVKTVETHRIQIMERLGIHDVAGLVRYAIRMGIISPDK